MTARDTMLAGPEQATVSRRDTGAALLAAGGFATAFGAASCCALPLALGALGLGGAWLGGLAIFFAPYRIVLLMAAAVCLLVGGALSWRRRRDAAAEACASADNCPAHRRGADRLTTVALSATALLIVAALAAG
jgi:mercuric ion transport protein